MKEFESGDTWRLKNDVEDALLTVIDIAAAVKDVREGKEGGKTLRRRKRRMLYKLERMAASTVDALKATERFDKLAVTFHSSEENQKMKSAMADLFYTMRAALVEMERILIRDKKVKGEYIDKEQS